MTEESGERQVGTPEGRKARLEERHRQRQEAETEARERLAGLGAQDNGEPDFHRSGERGAEAPTEAEAELRDAIIGRLRESGIEVVEDSEAGQRVLDEANGKNVMLNARKKKSLETDSVPQEEHQRTVISSDDGAKVLNNLDDLIKEYENSVHTKEKTFIGNAAKALGAKRYGSKSEYATFETVNGNEVTIRLSDHNASVERMDNAGKDNAISIVISRKGNKGIQGTGKARIVEYYYSDKKLRQAGDGSLPSDAHGGILGRDDGHDRAGQGRQHVRRAGGGRRQLRAGLPGLGQRGRDGVPRRAGAAFHVGLRQG